MALEGGYDIPAICDATEHTIRALLGDELQPISDEELNRKPCQAAIDTLRKTIDIQVPSAGRHKGWVRDTSTVRDVTGWDKGWVREGTAQEGDGEGEAGAGKGDVTEQSTVSGRRMLKGNCLPSQHVILSEIVVL